MSRRIDNLALIGFMGVGKSSVGQLLAASLKFEFLDTDAWIESRVGKSIQRVFAEEGESYFRSCEQAVVEDLARRRGLVIATGGGVGAHAAHLASLKEHALVVWLWATAETVWDRVRHQTHRPLLQTADPLGRIRELLAEREPVYRQADLLVSTEMRSPREVANLVLHQFQEARRDAVA